MHESQAIWLKECNMNSKLFHKMVNMHQGINHIGCLAINIVWSSLEDEVDSDIIWSWIQRSGHPLALLFVSLGPLNEVEFQRFSLH